MQGLAAFIGTICLPARLRAAAWTDYARDTRPLADLTPSLGWCDADDSAQQTYTALGAKCGLSRETIRTILDRDRRRTERNKRLAAKAQHWGLRGHQRG